MTQLPRGCRLACVAALFFAAGCDKGSEASASPTPAESTAATTEEPMPDPKPHGPHDPCAGKACGDPCTICAPDDADCVETMVVKACNASAECTAEKPACGDEVEP
jgi:hypothetical protein